MKRFVALLKGINVSGRNRVPMAELRKACAALGWSGIQTYIQSGNLLFTWEDAPDAQSLDDQRTAAEAAIEAQLVARFAVHQPVVVRSMAEWLFCRDALPWPQRARAEPNRMMLAVAKNPLDSACAATIASCAAAGEEVCIVPAQPEAVGPRELFIHFPAGQGASRITPSLLDRAAGSPVTMRNWRTVEKIAEMLTG